MRYVALLRGINVGGKNILPMKALTTLFEEVACTEVGTYIQSGNVVFTASADASKRLGAVVTERIAERFGLRVPVVIRSARELRAAAMTNPFPKADVATLHVGFLANVPNAAAIAALDPTRSSPDAFVVRAREIYMCLPNGVGKTKLTNAYFDSKLGTTMTVRNWRTVQKLRDLVDAA